jgi:hypothetical protein
MRILKGLASRILPCGCVVGIYETYDAQTVAVVDAQGTSCHEPAHQPGKIVPVDQLPGTSTTQP